MDPFLEKHWLAVHTLLIALSSEQLNQKLPEGLVARPEERLVIDAEEWPDEQAAYPDVRVFQPGLSNPEEGEVALEAPFKLVVDLEPLTERWIKIVKLEDEQLIAVIEFVSPRNKRGKGVTSYHSKRKKFLQSGANIVEIDLVRQGNWRALLRPHRCPPEAVAAYRATVRLAGDRRGAYLYPLPLHKPLRPIPIPLRAKDPSVLLELQPMIDRIYAGGRYADTVNYSAELEPPLAEEERKWTQDVLRTAGKI
jgi:hypothetical protein